MATIILNVPDPDISRIVLAMSARIGFESEPTPDHAKDALIEYIHNTVRIYESTKIVQVNIT